MVAGFGFRKSFDPRPTARRPLRPAASSALVAAVTAVSAAAFTAAAMGARFMSATPGEERAMEGETGGPRHRRRNDGEGL